MRCLDSLGIKPQLHVFWTGADSVWWEWRPQVEWKCFPSNDLLRSKSGQCHLDNWTNCPTVEHCGHPGLIEKNIYHTESTHCDVSTITMWSRSGWTPFFFYRFQVAWCSYAQVLKCSFTQVLMWPGQEVRRSSQKSKKMSKGLASPSSMGNVTMCQRGPIEPNSLIHMTLGHTTVLWWLSQMWRRGLVWAGWKLTPWPTTWQTLATLILGPVCH